MIFLVLYKTFVFEYKQLNKLGQANERNKLIFIEEFTGSAKEFTMSYQQRYPHATKMIFMDKKKPLRRDIRIEIEKSEKYKQMMRAVKLVDILGS